MDRGGVTQDQLIELPKGIGHNIVVKRCGLFFLFPIDADYITNIAAPANEETMDTPNSPAFIGFPQIRSCPWNMPYQRPLATDFVRTHKVLNCLAIQV